MRAHVNATNWTTESRVQVKTQLYRVVSGPLVTGT